MATRFVNNNKTTTEWYLMVLPGVRVCVLNSSTEALRKGDAGGKQQEDVGQERKSGEEDLNSKSDQWQPSRPQIHPIRGRKVSLELLVFFFFLTKPA